MVTDQHLKSSSIKRKTVFKINLGPSTKTPREMVAIFKNRLANIREKKEKDVKKIPKKKTEIEDLNTIREKVKRLGDKVSKTEDEFPLECRKNMTNRVLNNLEAEDSKPIYITLKNNNRLLVDSLISKKISEINKKIYALEKLIPGKSCQRIHSFQLDDLDIETASEKIRSHFSFLKEDGYLSLGREFKDATEKLKIFREKYDNIIREEIKLTQSKIKMVINIFYFNRLKKEVK